MSWLTKIFRHQRDLVMGDVLTDQDIDDLYILTYDTPQD